ncbi:MAG: squalene synthase HpnC [Chloroflexi bacterium]|nr:squalene synthase HpnC [Chloroflexota bacterium]
MPAAVDERNPSNEDPGAIASAEPVTLAEAYRHCETLARSHYENFNVGGWITPRQKLPHVYAIYSWCRMVDDLGDESLPSEPVAAAVDNGQLDHTITTHRRSQLAWWEDELEAIYCGQPTHPISIAVQHTVDTFDIPREPFQLLIKANVMDQGSGRFETLDDVLEYCRHSANPVGHLYLYLFGYPDRRRLLLADHTCTALQLTNFWQDVGRDYADRGRIYLPRTDMDRFGVTESDIANGSATEAFRSLLRYECDHTMRLFQQGAPLVASLDRRAQLPVALFTRGGVAVLHAIRQQGYDVLSRRPALSKRQKAWLLASAWLGSKLGTGYGLPRA